MNAHRFSQNMMTAFNERKDFAVRRFIDCYQPIVLLKVEQKIGNRPDSGDLVTDILVKMYQMDTQFETIRNMERYLAKVINSICREYIEDSMKPVINMNGFQAHIQQIEEEASEQAEIKRTATTVIMMAIEMLPGQCREIFILSKARGLRNKEIAELLKISEKTVENQMNIALNKVRNQCRKDGIDMYYINLLLPILWSQFGSI
jgi:RNA polymerase sigma factor (sigma-70 family)